MRHLFFLFFGITISSTFSQNEYSLSGKITDENGNIVSIGDVLLYDENQENLIKYTTLVDGNFLFETIKENKYYLKIAALGYQDYEEELFLNSNRKLQIVLKERTTELEEVEVIAAKNPITNNNGNLKIDVQNPIFSSIPDPLDVLGKLPNVQITPNRESISIIGNGSPLIYLEGQRISFEEFIALAVDAIESIELLTNPSAKYEAEGRAVLLITRNKNSQVGIKANVSETASFRRNFNNYLNTNTSYSNGKWVAQGNFTYNDLGQWESNTFAFSIPEENIFSNYLVLVPFNKRKEINGSLGLFYPLKKEDYLSFNTTFRKQTNDAPIETETFIQNNEQEDSIISASENDNTKDYFSGNFNFDKSITKGLNLFTGFQYSSFKQTLDTKISNNFNDMGFNLDQVRNQFYKINSLAFKLDLSYNISDKVKWEIGTNLSEANAEAFTKIETLDNNLTTVLDFDYKEQLYAGYSMFSGQINKKINYNLGTRIEYNRVRGELEDGESPLIERENTNLFPRAGLNIQVDSTKALSINYARSVSRPNFSRTSSVRTFINPFLEGENNINLLPTFTSRVSANFQWKNKSFNARYYISNNPVNFTIRFDGNDSRAILAPVNLERESGYVLELTLPFSHKKWTSTNIISLNYNRITDNTAIIGNTNPYIYAYSKQQFNIKKDIAISFGGWLVTRREEGIFKRNGLVVLDTTITKTFFERLHCAIRLNDITRAMNFEESYAINGVEADGTFFVDGQEVAFSIKYDFGNIKKSKFKNKNVDENLERIK